MRADIAAFIKNKHMWIFTRRLADAFHQTQNGRQRRHSRADANNIHGHRITNHVGISSEISRVTVLVCKQPVKEGSPPLNENPDPLARVGVFAFHYYTGRQILRR